MASQFEPQERLAARDLVSLRRAEEPGQKARAQVRGRGFARTEIAAVALVFILGAGGVIAYQPIARLAESLLSARVVAEDASPMVSAKFTVCTVARQQNCVLDGDTLRFGGATVRIADIDAPEVFSPECAAELKHGNRATDRLLQLVNSGPFEVAPGGGKDRDLSGHALRLLLRGGRSVGATLVAEGLARTPGEAQRGWC